MITIIEYKKKSLLERHINYVFTHFCYYQKNKLYCLI